MVFLTNLLYYERHITESDNGCVPYRFFAMLFFHSPRVKFVPKLDLHYSQTTSGLLPLASIFTTL